MVLKLIAASLSCAYFFYVFAYAAIFLGDVASFAPDFNYLWAWFPTKTVDLSAESVHEPHAAVLARNLLLLALFAVQHSTMTRPAFKRAMSTYVPAFLEQSIYMIASSATLHLLMNYWVPIVKPMYTTFLLPGSARFLPLVYFAGVCLAFLHVGLSGFRTIFISERPSDEPFTEGFLNQISRHPSYLGFLIMLWAHPVMTYGHTLFSAAMSVYIFMAIQFEERDLEVRYGEAYIAYKRRTPMLIPTRNLFGMSTTPTVRVAARAD